MSKVTAKQQYWADQLKQADAFSGSLTEFAHQQGIAPQTLYRWRNALQNREVNHAAVNRAAFTKVEPPALSPLPSTTVLTVQVGPAQLVFNQLPDTRWLNQLITAHD